MDILEYDLNIANTIVTTAGNVGIGTTSPSSKLDIAGSLNVIGDINFTGNLLQNGGSQWTTTDGNVSYTSGTVVVSGGLIANGNSNTIGTLFTTGGNVGIGKSNPSVKLDIDGGLIATSATIPQLVITDASASTINITSNLLATGNSNTVGSLFTTGGNVGIGTSSPSKLLSLGTVNNTQKLAIYDDGTGNNVYGFGAASSLLHFHAGTNNNAAGQMVLNNAGNVGIGTTSPLGKLSVDYSGISANQNVLSLHTSNTVTNDYNLIEAGHGASTTFVLKGNGNVGIGTTSPLGKLTIKDDSNNIGDDGGGLFITGTDTTNKRLHMGYDDVNNFGWMEAVHKGVNIMPLILQGRGGNVGIGTTSPSFKLDVNGTFRGYGGRYIIQNGQDGGTGRGIYMWNESDTNWSIYMGQSGAGKSFSGGTATTGVYGFNQHAVRFRANNSSVNGWIFENNSETHLMSIRSDLGHVYMAGNLGIGSGAVSPASKLHVFESTGTVHGANSGTIILDHDNSGGASSITFRSKANRGNDYGYIQYQDASSVGGSGESARLIIGTQNDGDDHILLSPSGNVGINNASPGYKLQVGGDIYADGGWLRVSGNNGLFFESYGGGWHMTDGTWVRAVNGKNVYTDGSMHCNGDMYSNSSIYCNGEVRAAGSRARLRGDIGYRFGLNNNEFQLGFINGVPGMQWRRSDGEWRTVTFWVDGGNNNSLGYFNP